MLVSNKSRCWNVSSLYPQMSSTWRCKAINKYIDSYIRLHLLDAVNNSFHNAIGSLVNPSLKKGDGDPIPCLCMIIHPGPKHKVVLVIHLFDNPSIHQSIHPPTHSSVHSPLLPPIHHSFLHTVSKWGTFKNLLTIKIYVCRGSKYAYTKLNSPRWHHMGVMASHIVGNVTLCWTIY